jgi:ABC-type multidrug transport system fused ATPase/permease subunit
MNIFKKILSLLSFNEKKKLFFIIIMTLIVSILDIIGIGSILPFVTLLTNSNIVETNTFFSNLYNKSKIYGITNVTDFLFLFGIIFLLVFFLSIIFRGIISYMNIKFSLMLEHNTSMKLVKGYLNKEYSWFLDKNSSDLSKNILSEVGEVIEKAILPFMNIITNGIIIFGVLLFLFIFYFKISIFIFLFFILLYLFFSYFVKKFLNLLGTRRVETNEKRYRILSEIFKNIKQIKFQKLENIFIDNYSGPSKINANTRSLASALTLLPRFFLEAIIFGGLIIIILIQFKKDLDFLNNVAIYSIFIFAAYRLMPSLQQVYMALSNLRFSEPALNLLITNLNNIELDCKKIKEVFPPIFFTKYISLNKIYFKYPGSKKEVLKDINMLIPAFKRVAIIGKTGSGKTTLIDIILGLLSPNNGSLMIDGKNIIQKNENFWQKIISYVPQEINLIDDSLVANIGFGIDIKKINKERVKEVAKVVDLHNFIINELPEKYNTKIGENGIRLSGGQRQRIGIARALYSKPQILILDEATSALDNLTEKFILDAINNLKNKMTIIIVTHHLRSVKDCDVIFKLEKGKLKKSILN